MFINRISGALVAVVVGFNFGTASSDAANSNRSFDTGQPRELINQPVCSSREPLDDQHNCDFAQRT
jgi:hypothetical protein